MSRSFEKMKGFLLFAIVLVLPLQESVAVSDEADALKNGLDEFLHTGVLPQYLKDLSKKHQFEFSFFEAPSIQNFTGKISCSVCDGLVNSVISLKKIHTPNIILKGMMEKVCTTFHLENQRVCDGLLGSILDVVFYIIDNGRNITAPKLCNLVMGSTCHNQFEFYNWTIEVPPKPVTIPKKIITKDENIRILHLTDMHIDPRYTAGSNALCDETLCCQDDQGVAENPEESCGVWGDYRKADTPMKLLEETLRHLKTQKFDYVYSTGDIIPHRVWSTSREGNQDLELKIMNLLRDTFDVPILFVLGNHEPHPLNMYAPINVNKTNLSTKWLYDTLQKEQQTIFPNGDLESIEDGGFYTVLLKPGFRVIVLNNIVCYTENYWLAYDDYDVYGQLAWLIRVLQRAEDDGEYVHILYHVPTGDHTCLGAWARAYHKIVNRFTDTISGQFNGHTHADEFFLFYNESNPTEAIQVAFNGASLSTFVDNNPSYKIYDVNTRNYQVEDFEEWTFNLTAANMNAEKSYVDWYKLYSFKDTYGLSSLAPRSIGQFVDKMAGNKTLLEIFNALKYRMGPSSEALCDDDCHKANLCRIVTTGLADTFHCDRIKNIYDENIKKSLNS